MTIEVKQEDSQETIPVFKDIWVVKNVEVDTIKSIRILAVKLGLTIPKTLKYLAEQEHKLD